MKGKMFLSFFCLILLLSSNKEAFAQCELTIQGDTCAHTLLLANTCNIKPQKLNWYNNGELVFTSRRTGINPNSKLIGHTENGFPMGLTEDEKGNIYVVCDSPWINYSSIVRFSPGSKKGTVVAYPIVDPIDVAVYKDTMYIMSLNEYCIYKWIAGADTGTKIITFENWDAGWGIFVDSNNNLYYTLDQSSNGEGGTVFKLPAGSTTPLVVAGGNGYGSTNDKINFPADVVVDKEGNIYVSDVDNSRVMKWVPGADSGIIIAGGNGDGHANNQISLAYQICLDSINNVYVAEQGNERISRWAPDATAGITVAGGYNIEADTSFTLDRPRGIYSDKQGNLIVSTIGYNRILKFAPFPKDIYPGYIPPVPGNYAVKAFFRNHSTAVSSIFHVNDNPVAPTISGPTYASAGQQGLIYSVHYTAGETYAWTVPKDANIVSGQGTDSIVVNWGSSNGRVQVFASNGCGASPTSIKQVRVTGFSFSFDNTITYSKKNTLTVYPNPVNSLAILTCNLERAGAYTLSIMDVNGRLLKQENFSFHNGTNSKTIDVSNLASGVYFLKLSNSSNLNLISKIYKH